MLNSFKHTRQLQIMENMNYPGNSWEGCLSWLPSRRRPILSGAPYPQISPHPGQLKILRIHVHVLLLLIYPLHCFISIVDAWDLLEFMIYQSCSEGGPLFLALRILKFSIYQITHLYTSQRISVVQILYPLRSHVCAIFFLYMSASPPFGSQIDLVLDLLLALKLLLVLAFEVGNGLGLVLALVLVLVCCWLC